MAREKLKKKHSVESKSLEGKLGVAKKMVLEKEGNVDSDPGEDTQSPQVASVTTNYNVIKTTVLSKQGKVLSSSLSNDEFITYPGASTTLNLMARVIQEGEGIVCEEGFTNIRSFLQPNVNSAGVPTVLQSTSFADPYSDGEVVWGYEAQTNPLVLSVWDLSIPKYTVSASGTGCADYVQEEQFGTFYLTSRALQAKELAFDATRSVCPSVSYDPLTNTAGLIGKNPVFDKAGCSIVYQVKKLPYAAEFGFLQIARSGASGQVTDEEGTSSLFLLEEDSRTVDCIVDSKGNYKSITSRTLVPQGGSADLIYNSTVSFFAAPYFSMSSDLNRTDLIRSSAYSYSNVLFDTYLMTKMEGESFWLPIDRINWGVDALKVKCLSAQPCGTGLGPDKGSPYQNTAWDAKGLVTLPKMLDAKWLKQESLPKWTDIFQNSFLAHLNVTAPTIPPLSEANDVGQSYVLTAGSDRCTLAFAFYAQIQNFSPYTFVRTALDVQDCIIRQGDGTDFGGAWKPGSPIEVLYPYTANDTAKVSSGWPFGSGGATGRIYGCISYDAQLEGASRGTFKVTLSEGQSGGCGPSNGCHFKYNISTYFPGAQYFTVTTQTTIGGDGGHNYWHDVWKNSTAEKNDQYGSRYYDCSDWGTMFWSGVNVRDGWPLYVNFMIQWNPITAPQLLQKYATQDPASYWYKALQSERDCFYTGDSFNSSRPIDGGIEAATYYNSVAWSIGRADRWYQDPLISSGKARGFYTGNGYTEVTCNSGDAKIALYCVPDLLDPKSCGVYSDDKGPYKGTFTYTHAAVKNDNYGWSSKFGSGWLLTQGSMNDISSEKCADKPEYGWLHYGKPALCFGKGLGSIQKEQKVSLGEFSQNELMVLKREVDGVESSKKSAFEDVYKEWVDFCNTQYHWSSVLDVCAQGEAFENLVHIGKERFEDIKPLLAEKLANPSHFLSSLLYEAISQTHRVDNVDLSLQEVAEGYAHELISEMTWAYSSEMVDVI
jgi:hypothetical protein